MGRMFSAKKCGRKRLSSVSRVTIVEPVAIVLNPIQSSNSYLKRGLYGIQTRTQTATVVVQTYVITTREPLVNGQSLVNEWW